jgi:hypothetical protein
VEVEGLGAVGGAGSDSAKRRGVTKALGDCTVKEKWRWGYEDPLFSDSSSSSHEMANRGSGCESHDSRPWVGIKAGSWGTSPRAQHNLGTWGILDGA